MSICILPYDSTRTVSTMEETDRQADRDDAQVGRYVTYSHETHHKVSSKQFT